MIYALNHKCIVMLLVLLKYITSKNDIGWLFGLSEFEFNKTYNFRFIFENLYISCRFLFFLHLHKGGSTIHDLPYSGILYTRTLDGKICRYAFNRNVTVLHLKGIINETRLTLAHIFHESLVPYALLIYIYIYIPNAFNQ